AKTPAVPYKTGLDLLSQYRGSDTSAVSRRTPLHVLYATLPDPVDSRLDWAYDAGLESVRRAFEEHGFVTDRFWLPWTTRGDTARAHWSDMGPPPVRVEHPG